MSQGPAARRLKRRDYHRQAFRHGLWCILAGVMGLVFGLWVFTGMKLELPQLKALGEISYQKLAVGVALVFFMIWPMRVMLKVTLGELHLSR